MEHFLTLAGLTERFLFLIITLMVILGLIVLYLWDITQKEHTILRNYPVIGHIRYLAEKLGVYLRQYFYARDHEEMPFNRHQREWVYHAAIERDTTIGFGSTRNLKEIGSCYFVDAPFPTLETDISETKPITFGPQCKNP